MTESAENAFQALKNKYPDDQRIHNIPDSGMVPKTINNHCALGVYILQQSKGTNNCWELASDNEHPFVPAGT
jgi:hypothetical protein